MATPHGHADWSPEAANDPDVDNLRHIVHEQSRQKELLIQEVQVREEERWRLVKMLTSKDEQLRVQEETNERQRAVLQATRSTASYYRVLCAMRAWQEAVYRTASQRAIAHAKGRLTIGLLKQVCRVIYSSLRHAVRRQTKVAFDALWFNAISKEIDLDLPDLGELADFSTPRRRSEPQWRQQDAVYWKPSPSRGSEASTTMPLSSPRCTLTSGTASPEKSGTIASGIFATHLATVLQKVCRRQVGLAFRQLHFELDGSGAPIGLVAPAAAASLMHDSAPSAFVGATTRSSPSRESQSSCVATTTQDLRGGLRARCSELEGLALRTSTTEAVLREQVLELQELQGAETAECASVRKAEQRVLQELMNSRAACEAEEEAAEELRQRAAACKADLKSCQQQEAVAARQFALLEERVSSLQDARHEAEARLSSEAQWRSDAEKRMKRMVSRGEALERDRARHLDWRSQSRQQHLVYSEECEALQQVLRQEEEAKAATAKQLRMLEESNSELQKSLQRSETHCLTEAERHSAEQVTLLQDLAGLRAEMLTASTARWTSEERAAEAARSETVKALTRERAIWASELSKLNCEFEEVRARLAEARRNEESEAAALARANVANDTRLKEQSRHGSEVVSAAEQELAEEAATCSELKAELSREIAEARSLQNELAMRMEVERQQQQREQQYCKLEKPSTMPGIAMSPAPNFVQPACPPAPAALLSAAVPPLFGGAGGHASCSSSLSCSPQLRSRQTLPIAAPAMEMPRSGTLPAAAASAASASASAALLAPHGRSTSLWSSMSSDRDRTAENPQMDELDAYALLVKRLQAEIQWERDERETSTRSLESVQSSYGLLLERASGTAPTATVAAALDEKPALA